MRRGTERVGYRAAAMAAIRAPPDRGPAWRLKMTFEDELKRARIVPVMTIRENAHAVPLARALCDGGLNILEITLRTPDALDCIAAIAGGAKDAIVGAGTVINGALLNRAVDAGARFIVSPGLTEDVAQAARARGEESSGSSLWSCVLPSYNAFSSTSSSIVRCRNPSSIRCPLQFPFQSDPDLVSRRWSSPSAA